MRRLALLAACVVAFAGCRTDTGTRIAPTPVNVDDMMGWVVQQTVFVAEPGRIRAITLLNHFTRYRIETNGLARVAADAAEQWLYVLDSETPTSHRLRVFEIATGAERAAQSGIADVARDQRVLARAPDGRVLVLKADADRTWIDAYEGGTLRPLGAVVERAGCGDTIVSSSRRIAIVCRSTGAIALHDLRGSQAVVEHGLPNIVAVSMALDGTLYVASADRRLGSVGPGATTLTSIPFPGDWWGTALPDGLGIASDGRTAVLAQHADDGAWLRIFTPHNVVERRSVRLSGPPQGGVLVLWPFAYYSFDRAVRHVDLNSGLLESMAEVGEDAIPVAVVNN